MSIPQRPIALLGMRGAGKTSVGRLLAQELERPFLDLDDEVLRAARHAGHAAGSIGALLELVGVGLFRHLEAECLGRILEPGPCLVLATGGGVLERSDARAWLARTAFCVWLRVDAETLTNRLSMDPAVRPALLGENPVAEVPALLARREPAYRRAAELEVDAAGEPAEVARAIAERLGAQGDALERRLAGRD